MFTSLVRPHTRGKRAVLGLLCLVPVLLSIGVPNGKDQIATVDSKPITIDSSSSSREQVRSKLNTIFGFTGPRLSTSVGATFEADAERCVIRFNRATLERQFPGIESGLVEGEALDLLNLPKLYRFDGRILFSTYAVECRKLESLKTIGEKSKFFSIDHDIPNIRIRGVPNDSLYSTEQFNLLSSPQASSEQGLDAVQVWDARSDSSSIVIGIIDTGIAYSHPDLKDNMWVNPGEIAGNGMDDDSNGYIDDVYGADARAHSDSRGDPVDASFHGTTVASVIGARGNNALGMAGVSWKSKLMAIKVLDPEQPGGTLSDMINGIEYAIMMRQRWIDNDPYNGGANVRVLNISVGIPGISCTDSKYSTTLKAFRDVLLEANNVGITIITAAGNNGTDVSLGGDIPGSCDAPNLITVAATDPSGNLLCFSENCANGSNYGAHSIHLAAPGQDILGARPQTAEASLQDERGGKYEFYDGTSVAAPQVAGVVALMLAENQYQTPAGIKERIISSARGSIALEGLLVSSGILDGLAALEVAAAAVSDWHNATFPEDVNQLNGVTTADILETYNTLFYNHKSPYTPTVPNPNPTPAPTFIGRTVVEDVSTVPPAPPKVDVNYDGKLSIADYQMIRTKFLSLAPATSIVPYTSQIATKGESNTFATGAARAAPILVPADITYANATFQNAGRAAGQFTWVPQTRGCKVFEFATENNQIYRYFVAVNNPGEDNVVCSGPQVWITWPGSGAVLSGTATILVDAVGTNPISRVQLLVDGTPTGSPDTTYPYAISLSLLAGNRELKARATDTSGLNAESPPVTITVGDFTPPDSVTITSPLPNALKRQKITVSASATDNVGITRIEYYVDSNPLPFSTKSGASSTSDPLDTTSLSDTSHTIRAKAFDAAGLSREAMVTIIVDNQLPTGSIISPVGGTTITSSHTFSITASDNRAVASVKLLVDGTDRGTAGPSPYTVSVDTRLLTNAPHLVKVWVRDTAGNEFESQPIVIESWNVNVILSGPAGNPILPVTRSYAYTAGANYSSGLQAYDFRIDEGSWTNRSTLVNIFSVNPATLGNGQHAVHVRARHRTGLTSPISSLQFRVQRESNPPTVSIISPANGATIPALPTITIDARDDAGIDTVVLYVDGQPKQFFGGNGPTYTYTFTTPLTLGSHSIYATARDTSGNPATSAVVTVNVAAGDPIPPTVNLTAPAAGAFIGSTPVTVSATASDASGIDRVEFSIGNTPIGPPVRGASPYSTTLNPVGFAPGSYTIKAVAFDNAGVSNTSTRTVTIDKTGPTVTLTNPTAGSYIRNTVPITATASDPAGISRIELFVDGNRIFPDGTTSPYTLNIVLSNGPHEFKVVAYDSVGNSSEQRHNATVDNKLPSAVIQTPSSVVQSHWRATATVTGLASDNIGIQSISLLVDGSPAGSPVTASPYTLTFNTTGYSNNVHNVQVVVRDLAGNSFTTPPVSVIIDNSPPDLTIVSPTTGQTVWKYLPVTVNATDNVRVTKVEYYFDSEPSPRGILHASPVGPVDIYIEDLSDAPHILKVKAYDLAGNISATRTVTVNVRNIDSEPPTVGITAPAAGTSVGNRYATITANVNDNREIWSVVYYVGSTFVGSNGIPPYSVTFDTLRFASTSHTIYVRAFDRAGNEAEDSRSIKIDNLQPSVSFDPLPTGPVGGTVTLSATANDNVGVVRVVFYVGDRMVKDDRDFPWAMSPDTTTFTDGSYQLRAQAFDAVGLWKEATGTLVINNSDTQRPTVSFDNLPTAPLTGPYVFNATANDNVGVVRVRFTISPGLILFDDTSPPWSIPISDIRSLSATGHFSIEATAYDANGNSSIQATGAFQFEPIDERAAVSSEFISLPQNLVNYSQYPSVYASKVHFSSNGKLYVATDRGLAISSDYGLTFTTKTTAHGLFMNGVTAVTSNAWQGNIIYAVNPQGLAISTNGGQSFNRVRYDAMGMGDLPVVSVCAKGSYVFAISPWDFARSNDGGATWRNTSGRTTTSFNPNPLANPLTEVQCGTPDLDESVVLGTNNGFDYFTNLTEAFNKQWITYPFQGIFTHQRADRVFVANNQVLAGSFDGLLRANIPLGAGVRTVRTTANGLPSNTIRAIKHKGGKYYVGTDRGISISPDFTNFTNYGTASGLGSEMIHDLDAEGNNVWAATAGGLSTSTNYGANYTTHSAWGRTYPNPNVRRVFVDQGTYGRRLFMANASGGLLVSRDGGRTFQSLNGTTTMPASEPEVVITANDNIYVGTRYGGVFVSTNDGATFTQQTRFTDNTLIGLVTDIVKTDSTLVISGPFGMATSTDNGATFVKRFGTPVNALASSGNGVIIAFADKTLRYATDGGVTLTSLLLSLGGSINDVAKVGTKLYVATDVGIYRGHYPFSASTFSKLTGFGSTAYASVYGTEDGSKVYAGFPPGSYAGLNYSGDYGASVTLKSYPQGLPENAITAITGFGDTVYFSTPSGLARTNAAP